jgi:hypothetical protein
MLQEQEIIITGSEGKGRPLALIALGYLYNHLAFSGTLAYPRRLIECLQPYCSFKSPLSYTI